MDDLVVERDLFIGGEWTPAGGDIREVEDPRWQSPVGTVRDASIDDVDAAVNAAYNASPSWGRESPAERAIVLERLAEELGRHIDLLAATISAELGAPAALARRLHVQVPVSAVEDTAVALRRFEFSHELGNSTVLREPARVVAAITPWNMPLHQVVVKVIPALAAGAAVVLKPSELTPLTAFAFTRIIIGCGLPPGILNLVVGGPQVGEELVKHPLVRHVSFTGSTATGQRVGAMASAGVKRLTLELGGKSPSIVLADSDGEMLTKAVKTTVANCFLNTGQTCTALTRLIVPESQLGVAEEIAATAAAKYDPGGRLGPLISRTQLDRVHEFLTPDATGSAVELAQQPTLPDRGYYIGPHILSNADPGARVAREEVFGPVLTILAARDDEEALAIANDSDYGLAAAVWSSSESHAAEIARFIDAGQVDINGGSFNPGAPFGGFKRSGIGREIGYYGIDDFLETKSIQH